MTGSCVECGDEAAAGQFGTLCPECIVDETTRADADRIVLDTHYMDGRGRRLVAERPPNSNAYQVREYRLTKGEEWRPVGSEGAEQVTVRTD